VSGSPARRSAQPCGQTQTPEARQLLLRSCHCGCSAAHRCSNKSDTGGEEQKQAQLHFCTLHMGCIQETSIRQHQMQHSHLQADKQMFRLLLL